jgi:hypothetical protein
MSRLLGVLGGIIALLWCAAVCVSVAFPPWTFTHFDRNMVPVQYKHKDGYFSGNGLFLDVALAAHDDTDEQRAMVRERCRNEDCYVDRIDEDKCLCKVNIDHVRRMLEATPCTRSFGDSYRMAESYYHTLQAARAMLIISAVLALMAAMACCCASARHHAVAAVIAFSIMGMLFSSVGMACGYSVFYNVSYAERCVGRPNTGLLNLGVSFHLSWVSIILAFFVALIGCALIVPHRRLIVGHGVGGVPVVAEVKA